ncbi:MULTISPECIES: MFS transporter [unclassified Clostridium]|uniref:MDR-type permease n=1 Tax=Clostridium botulinum (strain Eklund 17B / Type B) TaxID=935198 RepID=B2TJX4_CLOBB|nr:MULTISPECIES: MFS transporter [unclassified Clostridium]ACD22241.1 MDR-type permease [Clostridium botulinum B str. Eklund 17B (NRP)]MBY6974680.1 MFS transporter [Clostridium botulinum]MBY6999666.1 MFS transporter [Clostridium botulinum]MCR1275100.1 MFS transporter [Clostridium botulinum]NFD70647.1 MFS transporter [Clostridium botulinum]
MTKTEKNNISQNNWIILAIVVMSPFMACLDSSIINVALPVMAKDLSTSMAGIQQIVTTYLIVISATILIFGRLGDIKGKTSVFKYGFIIFVLGSLFCGISTTLNFLTFSRIVQGIGAAMTMSTSQGIITHTFPKNERGRALGISGTFVALGTLLGPPLGGLIISVVSWEYIFLINVPIGTVAFIAAMKYLPKDKITTKQTLDYNGAILFLICIVSLFLGLLKGQKIGYNHITIILSFIIALVSFIVFIILESKIKNPLVDLSIFKNRVFSINVFCAFLSFVGISCINIIQPFYLQDVLELSPGTTGFIMMGYPIVLTIIAPLSGYLADKIGSKILTLSGLLVSAIGLFAMTTLNEQSSFLIIISVISIVALGNGIFQSPNNTLVMSSVEKSKLGIAGGINALIRNLGFVFGVSFSTTVLYNRMSYKIGYRVLDYVEGRGDVFIYGMKWVYALAAIGCIIGFIISLIDKLQIRHVQKSNESKITEQSI